MTVTDERLEAADGDEGSVGIGFAIGAILNVGLVVSVLLLTCATNIVEPFATICGALVLAIGVIQLVYILPLYFRYKRKGQRNTAKGLVIAASVTALLNATCWGWVLLAMRFE